ncbi:MAG: mechanosensitive ion channel family protein [Candidatus Thiodiazotropha taylori]|nr:mechanosensitive ion channel family protein [Candidatus Thiodiazotropha taylori]MCG8068584.1 mechanosensitive ion channel family protein [Candidatus Thiodiazotropha taylori]
MEKFPEFESFLTAISTYKISITITFVIIVVQLIILKFLIPRIGRSIEESNLKSNSFQKAKSSLSFISVAFSFALITFVWGFDFKGLMAISASVIALLGVSLFAGWSILSNVTAFFLLVFHQSYKRGNYIRVILGDNYIEGYISEINLFNTKLITENKEFVVYPNTLLILNPAIINSRERYYTVGKIADIPEKRNVDQSKGNV